MTKDKKGESTDALIDEARTFADSYDRIFGYGKVTEESRLMRRLIRQLEARRDRHMWRARAISMQGERDFLSVHVGQLEDRYRRLCDDDDFDEEYKARVRELSVAHSDLTEAQAALSEIRSMLESIEYYEAKPHKAVRDVLAVLRYLDGDERDDEG